MGRGREALSARARPCRGRPWPGARPQNHLGRGRGGETEGNEEEERGRESKSESARETQRPRHTKRGQTERNRDNLKRRQSYRDKGETRNVEPHSDLGAEKEERAQDTDTERRKGRETEAGGVDGRVES